MVQQGVLIVCKLRATQTGSNSTSMAARAIGCGTGSPLNRKWDLLHYKSCARVYHSSRSLVVEYSSSIVQWLYKQSRVQTKVLIQQLKSLYNSAAS